MLSFPWKVALGSLISAFVTKDCTQHCWWRGHAEKRVAGSRLHVSSFLEPISAAIKGHDQGDSVFKKFFHCVDLCLCVRMWGCAHACHFVHVAVRGQLAVVGSLLLPCIFQGLKPGCWSWQQATLPSEPPHWPKDPDYKGDTSAFGSPCPPVLRSFCLACEVLWEPWWKLVTIADKHTRTRTCPDLGQSMASVRRGRGREGGAGR